MAFSSLRSLVLWTIGWLHFGVCGAGLAALARLFGARRVDALTRAFSLNVTRLAGARVAGRVAPGVAAAAPCVFVANHINLFDPFVLYPVIPVFARGLELESHFNYPLYGWLMKSMGNVAVPDAKTPAGLRRMWDAARAALAAGTSLVVFPEGKRTRDGKMNPFRDGAFRLAIEAGVPVVPISIAGAFAHHHKGTLMLAPADIVVSVHAPIPTKGLTREDVASLRDRARTAVASALEVEGFKKVLP